MLIFERFLKVFQIDLWQHGPDCVSYPQQMASLGYKYFDVFECLFFELKHFLSNSYFCGKKLFK